MKPRAFVGLRLVWQNVAAKKAGVFSKLRGAGNPMEWQNGSMSTRLLRLPAPSRPGRLPCASAPARRVVEQPGTAQTIPDLPDDLLLPDPPPAAAAGVAASPRGQLTPEQRWRFSTISHSEGPLND
jgi:hypothetical protein